MLLMVTKRMGIAPLATSWTITEVVNQLEALGQPWAFVGLPLSSADALVLSNRGDWKRAVYHIGAKLAEHHARCIQQRP